MNRVKRVTNKTWFSFILILLMLMLLYARSCEKALLDTEIPDDAHSRTAGYQDAVLWEKPVDGNIGAFPFADESKAYLSFCWSGKVVIEAWRLADGERMWRIPLPYRCRADRLRSASLQLLGADQNLLVPLDDVGIRWLPNRGVVVALNKNDGSIRWDFKGRTVFLGRRFPFLFPRAEWSVIVEVGAGTQMTYIQLGASRLVALDQKTGGKKWEISLGYDRPLYTHLEFVEGRLYWGVTGLPFRVLDAKSGKNLPPPPFPEFVSSRMKLPDHWDRGWYVIGDKGLYFRNKKEKVVQLIGYDLKSGERMWTLEGEAFYPERVAGGKLYTLYRPIGFGRGWSLVNERRWIASIDERTGNIDWQVPYEGVNALIFLERQGPHVLAVDRARGAQVHRVDDGSLVWISWDPESADTLDSSGTRLLHIANGKVSLILLKQLDIDNTYKKTVDGK